MRAFAASRARAWPSTSSTASRHSTAPRGEPGVLRTIQLPRIPARREQPAQGIDGTGRLGQSRRLALDDVQGGLGGEVPRREAGPARADQHAVEAAGHLHDRRRHRVAPVGHAGVCSTTVQPAAERTSARAAPERSGRSPAATESETVRIFARSPTGPQATRARGGAVEADAGVPSAPRYGPAASRGDQPSSSKGRGCSSPGPRRGSAPPWPGPWPSRGPPWASWPVAGPPRRRPRRLPGRRPTARGCGWSTSPTWTRRARRLAAWDALGHLDCLVNNAGVPMRRHTVDLAVPPWSGSCG